MTFSPAYGHVGPTVMHAAPAGVRNTTTDALCGSFVILARGDYAAAANARGPLATFCPTCLRRVVAALS